MLNVGMTELLIFGIIALLILGPEKLPEAARFSGKWYAKIKRMISNVQNDIDRELRVSELREQMQSELKRIQELETKMQAQMNQLQQQNMLATAKPTEEANTQNKNTPTTFQYIGKNELKPLSKKSLQKVITAEQQHGVGMNLIQQSNIDLKVAV